MQMLPLMHVWTSLVWTINLVYRYLIAVDHLPNLLLFPPLYNFLRVLPYSAVNIDSWLLYPSFLQMELATYLYHSLSSIPGVRIYGPVPSNTVQRAALCTFNVENIHPTDIATFLDQQVYP